jgi:hypothetical protein
MGMNLTKDQARAVAESVHRKVGYFHRLRDRMQKTGRTDDPLYPLVVAAHDALHSLWVTAHYRGCGVSRPPDPDRGADRPPLSA